MARPEPCAGERRVHRVAVPPRHAGLCELCGADDLRSSLQCQSHRLDAVLRRHHDLQPVCPAELQLRDLPAHGRMLPDRRLRCARRMLGMWRMLRRVWDDRGLHDLPAVPLLAVPAVPALCDLSYGLLCTVGAGLLCGAGLRRLSDMCDLGLLCAGVPDLFLVPVLCELRGRGVLGV